MTKRRRRSPPRPLTEAVAAWGENEIRPIIDPATLELTVDRSHLGQPITAKPVGKLTVIRPRQGPIRTGLRRRGR